MPTTKKGNPTNTTTNTSDTPQTPMSNQTTLVNNTVNTVSVSPLRDRLVVEPTQRGKGFNLTAYAHEGWDMRTDLFVGANAGGHDQSHNLKVRDAAIEGLADFAAGNIRGNGYFFVVLPDDKLEAICSLSTLGYLFSDCPAGQTVEVGNGLVFTAPSFNFPRNGVLRLRQDGMGGIVFSEDDFIYPEKRNAAGYYDDWGYFHALVIRQLLAGGNVSVLLNSLTINDAHSIQAVAQSDNPVQANWDRKNANRDAARVGREARATQKTEALIAEVTGVAQVVTEEQLNVTGYSVSTGQESKVNLLTWTGPVFYITEDGRKLANGYHFRGQTVDALKKERAALAVTMNSNGYRLALP